MAKDENKEEEMVEVPMKLLTDMQQQMADLEKKVEDGEAKNKGLEELFASNAETIGEPKIREKKNFEPSFRTVRIRKYPIAGDVNNLGYIVGWDNRSAYQEVDRTGVAPQTVDFLNVVFLGQERNKQGVLQTEKVRLLDLMNHGIQVHCKIVESKKESIKVPTNEEIDVTVFDPQHGLISTGDKIDGYITYSEIKYKIQIPGVAEPVWIDSVYANN